MRNILNIKGEIRIGKFKALGFLLLMSGIWSGTDAYSEMISNDLKNCNIQTGSCTQDFSNRKVTLDIHPKPVKAMKDLTFRVRISGKRPSASPYIDLGMPGMKMGPNRVVLKEVGEGTYEGTGVIVRCPSGRRIWKATVTLPDLGEVLFVFDVIY